MRQELAVCEKYQISHSHYLGGPAVWTPEDRALAEAFVEYQRGTCRDCGTRPEWWDKSKGGHRFAFVADTERCLGCETLEQLREQIPREEKGLHVHLIPNPELVKQEEASDG